MVLASSCTLELNENSKLVEILMQTRSTNGGFKGEFDSESRSQNFAVRQILAKK